MIVQGDAKDLPFADQSFDCVVTSPPYFGLRRYGHSPDEIGTGSLSEYLDDISQVTHELRRVLKDDGLFWLNIGDTASGSGGAGGDYNKGGTQDGRPKWKQGDSGLAKKQWIGVPDRVKLMLQEGTLTGLSEVNAAWLAGLIDADGCFAIQHSKNIFCPAVNVAICDEDVLHYVRDITSLGTVRVKHDPLTHKGGFSKKPVYVWTVTGKATESLIRDLYPHLRIKQRQAQVLYALCQVTGAVGANVKLTPKMVEFKESLHNMVKLLNQRDPTGFEDLKLPRVPEPERSGAWLVRSEITWDKERLRPESLDHVSRPGISHEKIFMFAKQPKHRFYPKGLIEKGSVWHLPPVRKAKNHLAPFPLEIPYRVIKCSTKPGDKVLDPFAGCGTTLQAAHITGRIGYGLDIYEYDLPDMQDDESGRVL